MKPSRCRPNQACSPLVRGFPGKSGKPGAVGPVGPGGGEPGPPGKGIESATVNSSGHLIITFTDNTTLDAGLVVGPAGPPGTVIIPDPDPDPDPEIPGVVPRIIIIVTGDTGIPGNEQQDVTERITQIPGLSRIVLTGDNSYGGEAQFHNDLQAWQPWITSEQLIPVLGNHDIDGPSSYGLHTAKFPYLPGNRRYYNIVLGEGLVELFVLNDGVNTAFENPITSGGEPDDNIIGGAQHTWFVNALNASTAKWKLVFFHHPLVTTEETPGTMIVTAMDWPEFALVHGIFCGHAHLAEWLTLRGTPLINSSNSVRTDGNTALAIQGVAPNESTIIWVEDQQKVICKLNVTPRKITVDFIDVATGVIVYSRDLSDTTTDLSEWGGEILPPSQVTAGDTYFLGQSPVGMVVKEWFIGTAISGAPALTGTIKVNNAVVASWSIPAGKFYTTAFPTDNRLLYGSKVELVVNPVVGYETWQGLTLYAKGVVVR